MNESGQESFPVIDFSINSDESASYAIMLLGLQVSFHFLFMLPIKNNAPPYRPDSLRVISMFAIKKAWSGWPFHDTQNECGWSTKDRKTSVMIRTVDITQTRER